jgi:pimeloyl-ACP methyl ester carboxylesterase
MPHPLAFVACITLALAITAGPATAETLPRSDGGQTPIRRHGPQGGCGPTMIFSHGFGGDETGGAELASAMAAQGWRVIAMGHRESGRRQLRQAIFGGGPPREGIAAGARDPEAHRLRFLDLDAALAEARRRCRPSRLVLAGHSMGAMTTMLEAGATASFGRYGANRFDAYVAISPQGVGSGFTAGSWAGVTKPVLMITGTRDQALEGGPETRLSAFAGLPPGRKRLAVIPGAGHLMLAATGKNGVSRAVSALTLEFLADIEAGGLRPSRVPGVDVRDK